MKTMDFDLWSLPRHSDPEEPRVSMTEEELQEKIRRIKEKGELTATQRNKQEKQQLVEIDPMVAELKELAKLIPQEEEEDLEQALKKAEAYYKAIPMYDWGARINSNEQDISQKYGSRITSELRRCHRDGYHIPKSLIADMHRIHEGKKPLHYLPETKVSPVSRPAKETQKPRLSQVKWDEIQKRTNVKPKEYMNSLFSTVKAGLFNLARANKQLQNPTTLLLYLLQHRAWEGKKDKHGTYETWYLERKLIVASVSVEKICADLGVNEKTIRNWTNALHKIGVIRKLKEGHENVYILGEVVNKEDLFYYSGEISWKVNPA